MINGGAAVPTSILEAIKLGEWDYEPNVASVESYDSTRAMPGTEDKLQVLARRVAQGLPLWHPRDRRDYDEVED